MSDLLKDFETAVYALHKIADPEKHHHWEVDPYTRAECFQQIAQDALAALNLRDWSDKTKKNAV